MIRVVLDTNVIVSALLQPLGPPAQVFILALGGVLQLCLSANLNTNTRKFFAVPSFSGEEMISTALRDIRE
jgi:predicted nucleic acid-binding protein